MRNIECRKIEGELWQARKIIAKLNRYRIGRWRHDRKGNPDHTGERQTLHDLMLATGGEVPGSSTVRGALTKDGKEK